MGHKPQANVHHLLLELQDSTKYDSICFMLQDLHSKQSNTDYRSGLENYVEELVAEWPEYSGFPPTLSGPHHTSKLAQMHVRAFGQQDAAKPCGWAIMALLASAY